MNVVENERIAKFLIAFCARRRGALEFCRNPWVVNYDGYDWTVAMDESLLLAVRGAHGGLPMDKYIAKSLERVMHFRPPQSQSVSLATLKSFAGELPDLSLAKCELCRGRGTYITPKKTLVHCANCDSRGQHGIAWNPRPASVGGQVLDMCYLSIALHLAAGEMIEVKTSPQASQAATARFETDGFFSLLMPLRIPAEITFVVGERRP